MSNLNNLRDKIHTNAKAKGFYDAEAIVVATAHPEIDLDIMKHAFFAQKISLIHFELSEALEADRNNNKADLNSLTEWIDTCQNKSDNVFVNGFDEFVKNSIEDELADSIIRILDLCGYMNIDIERHVCLKIKYNESRVYRHGKEY